MRRRSTLPSPFELSTIDLKELNYRIRNGNGCFLLSKSTSNCALACQFAPNLPSPTMRQIWGRLFKTSIPRPRQKIKVVSGSPRDACKRLSSTIGRFFRPARAENSQKTFCGQADRQLVSLRLKPFRVLHRGPINPVVSRVSTAVLPRQGSLFFGRAWRLYAFSAYLFRT